MGFNNFIYDHDGIEFYVYYKKSQEGEPVIDRIMLGKYDVTNVIQDTIVYDFINDKLTEKWQNDDL